MNQKKALEEVRQLAGEAQPEKALQQLLELLRSDTRYQALENDARQALAQLRHTEREARQGIASSEQTKLSYNRVTRQILAIADALERGEYQTAAASEPTEAERSGHSNTWLYLLGVLLLIGLGGFGWWMTHDTSGNAGELPQAQASDACPGFPAPEAFRILLLPFQQFNEHGLRPHLAIGYRLGRMKEQYGIRCGIRFYDLEEDDPNRYPSTDEEATAIGQRCDAQLIIWGSSEEADDAAIIQTRYRFIDQKSLPLHKLAMTGDAEIDTVSTISSIATEGLLTSSIEKSIKLLFGLIAHSSGNEPVAAELLEDSRAIQDPSAALTRDVVLADIYLSKNDRSKASALYDSVLSRHPDYALALNNRALLYYEKGKYAEAAEDLKRVMPKDTKADTQLLEIRADAYIKSDQLQEARSDLQQLRSLKRSPKLDQKMEELKGRIQQEERIKQNAERQLQRNPSDAKALEQLTASSRKLGDYDRAIQSAKKLLKNDPRNARGYAELIQAYRAKGETEKVKEAIRNARRNGLDARQIERRVPAVRFRQEDSRQQ